MLYIKIKELPYQWEINDSTHENARYLYYVTVLSI
jgi:hypothetical protein